MSLLSLSLTSLVNNYLIVLLITILLSLYLLLLLIHFNNCCIIFCFYLIYYFVSTLFYFYYYYFVFSGYIFYITYASKVRATCIIVPYNDSSKAPIRLPARGRSCLAFAKFGMCGLGIARKEKLSRLFNPVSIQE